jgi:hypothetical protein
MKMNTIHYTNNPTPHSHTHWQAPQIDPQAKACQRVCLFLAEKKKLKIPFPSKNFKNAITQSDTKTFGQLVAKLNTDKGCKTRTTITPACNRRNRCTTTFLKKN